MSEPAAVLRVEQRFRRPTQARDFFVRPFGRAVPGWWRAWKRGFDIVASSALLILLSPLLLALAAAVRLSSPGPALFSQMRVGRDGRLFRMFKFRTMIDGAHLLHDRVAHLNECDGPALKIASDPRLHGFGPFLRRTSLDELPQLWNVVRGEMSLVGPRPALPKEVEHYEAAFFERQAELPGITGVWQVSGRASVPFRRWMAMDRWYVRNWSPLVDLWILVKTLPAVLRRDGAL
jgi:lipopolysaccharide/colanic/teichoic acid biosynthesis glycosyltransferase